jgi:hypothetical protein
MFVNNLIVETLHPENIVAQLYNGKLNESEINNIVCSINNLANQCNKNKKI